MRFKNIFYFQDYDIVRAYAHRINEFISRNTRFAVPDTTTKNCWPIYKDYGGTPVTNPKYYQKNSPIYHARGASTPTLFLMGEPILGGADDYDSVRWLHKALKEQGVSTQYIRYPDEGHVFKREVNRKDALDRAVKWLEKYLSTSD